MKCCTCSKRVYLKCSLLSFSKFRTLGSSHFWSFCPASSGDNIMTSSMDSSSLYISTAQSGLSGPSANAVLPSSPLDLLSSFRQLCIFFLCTLTSALCSWLSSISAVSSSPTYSLRVLQWNAGGLRARSTELLHFISSRPVDLICIQKSNLNSSSSFQIPGLSVLRSDRTHSRSGISSPDATYTSGGVIIFVQQRLSFSKLFTASFSICWALIPVM